MRCCRADLLCKFGSNAKAWTQAPSRSAPVRRRNQRTQGARSVTTLRAAPPDADPCLHSMFTLATMQVAELRLVKESSICLDRD